MKPTSHLIPVAIVDIAEKMNNETNVGTRETYRERIEAVRDYCIEQLAKHSKNTRPPKK